MTPNYKVTSRTIAFVVPVKTVSPVNGRKGEHWASKARRAKSERLAFSLASAANIDKASMVFPMVVLLTRLSPMQLDDDNLRGAIKNGRDGIAEWLGVDDGDTERVRYQYEQEKCARGEYGVRVTVIMGARLHETLEML